MECDICGTKRDNLPVHCITCARSAIELPRIELARVLIDRDRIGKHVRAVIEGSEDKSSDYVSLSDSKGGLLVDRQECTKNVDLQRMKAETAEMNERVQLIADQADMLREQMETTRKQLEAKRALNAQRKSDLSSATYGIDTRRTNEADKVQHNIKRMDYKFDKVHRETVEMRLRLTNSAAKLAGLKMGRRKSRNGNVTDVYNIGPGTRLKIYDLRDLQDASHDSLSASLGLVAQLLVRVASYLGVRLPAEITLPHNDYPLATIFQPSSSYIGRKVPFPTAGDSSSNSPNASRTLEKIQLPKPRTLYIDRPLPHLAAQDAPAYALFIEGVSLLAYDIAWLCRTQGMKEDFNTWEDVCNMGRNLYRLLITQETRAPVRPENPLDKDIISSKGNGKAVPTRTSVGFGEISHATSHSFLNLAGNVQFLSGWALTPTKITDELRAFLFAEQQAQEWDNISQKEFEDLEDMLAQDPVVVGGKRRGLEGGKTLLSSAIAALDKATLSADDASEGGKTEERKKGVSGWTKLKSRNEE